VIAPFACNHFATTLTPISCVLLCGIRLQRTNDIPQRVITPSSNRPSHRGEARVPSLFLVGTRAICDRGAAITTATLCSVSLKRSTCFEFHVLSSFTSCLNIPPTNPSFPSFCRSPIGLPSLLPSCSGAYTDLFLFSPRFLECRRMSWRSLANHSVRSPLPHMVAPAPWGVLYSGHSVCPPFRGYLSLLLD
jgi:hypothetical protein